MNAFSLINLFSFCLKLSAENAYRKTIEKLEKKKAPKYSAKQASEEDKKMNLIFKQIDAIKEPSIWGTITPDQINETQKSWINYRGAWIAFAKIKYPKYSSESISTWFTKKRNHMLSSFTK